MVKILIVPMFLIFVASLGVIAVGLAYRAAKEILPSMAPLRWPWTAVLTDGVRYHHPGHTWAASEGRGVAAVGLDELGAKVVGAIDAVKLPKLGQAVRQGRAVWSLAHKGRTVDLVAPVTGRVVEVNEALRHDPSLINRSPYGQGWAFKTRVRRVREDLKNLVTGALARRLADMSKAWICDSFSPATPLPQPAMTYQDGGEIVEGFGDRLSDEQWERLKNKIFLTD
jgi:glycine cleavage system H protein